MSFWSAIIPEATTNQVLNPSAETTGNFAAHNSATVTRDTTYARYGDYSYKIVPGGTNRGINLTLKALANAAQYVTFYVYGTITGSLQVSLNSGSNYNTAAIIGGSTGGWVRYGVSIVAAQANGSTACIIRNTANETFCVDAGLVEQKSGYYTTYGDGDQPGWRWTGLRHASASTRDAQYRLGGREVDLYDDLGVGVRREFSGAGMAPITLNLQPTALSPGASFESDKVEARSLSLPLELEGATWPAFHQLRQTLIDALRPDLVRGRQAVLLGYKGANVAGTTQRTVYAPFRYESGLEFGNAVGFAEQPPVRLIAVDPFWTEDNRETAALSLQTSVSNANCALVRTNGLWSALGTGFNGLVRAIAVDAVRNRVYFGGNFTTADGVTVNRICYWNGTTFVAMDGGVNGQVNAIAIMPNGDVWIGGAFSTVGSGATATKRIARWNYAAGNWTAFNVAATDPGSGVFVYALAVDQNGLLYVGGEFENWNGTAAADYIVSYDGSSWAALSTGTNLAVWTLVVGPDNTLYLGGAFTTAGGSAAVKVASWNGSAFTSLSSASSASAVVYRLLMGRDGRLYAGGDFTSLGGTSADYFACWNGTAWLSLNSQINGIVYWMGEDENGLIYLSGGFTSAGGTALGDRIVAFNGSTYQPLDIDLPGSPVAYAIVSSGTSVYLGFSTTGTATGNAQTTVTTTATTTVEPTVTLIGPSSGSCTLQWLENQSTDEQQFYSLAVQAGEIVTLDMHPDAWPAVSDWRGQITDQPLDNSDDLSLLGGANTISVFVSGTTTGVALLMHWDVRHWSIDGAA